MSFYNEMLMKLSMPVGDTVGGVKLTLVDFKGMLVEGHKGIFSYAVNEIVISLKKGRLSVCGNGLKIREINSDEVFICGEITGIQRNE